MRKKKAKEEAARETRRITPIDIQQKEFRLAFRGYNERDVDEFLDELTGSLSAVVEENRRLREATGGLAAIGDTGDAAGGADEIVRRAREEADRIIREAETRAAGASSSVGPVDVRGIPSFLARERDFLQGMAGMIQGHAEAIREMARDARDRAQQPAATATSSATQWGTSEAAPETRPVSEEPNEEPAAQKEPAAEAPPEAEAPSEPEDVAAEARVELPEAEEEPPLEEPAPEEEPAKVSAKPAEVSVDPPAAHDAGQRSLRELFWGED